MTSDKLLMIIKYFIEIFLKLFQCVSTFIILLDSFQDCVKEVRQISVILIHRIEKWGLEMLSDCLGNQCHS